MTKLAAFEHGAVIARVLSPLLAELWTTLLQVKTPKYNCPVDLYSETTMDEMVGGSMPEWVSSQIILLKWKNLFSGSEEKLDPSGPAYKKWKQSKKFDPSRSEVLSVMRALEAGPRQLWSYKWLYFWMNRMMIDNTGFGIQLLICHAAPPFIKSLAWIWKETRAGSSSLIPALLVNSNTYLAKSVLFWYLIFFYDLLKKVNRVPPSSFLRVPCCFRLRVWQCECIVRKCQNYCPTLPWCWQDGWACSFVWLLLTQGGHYGNFVWSNPGYSIKYWS